MEIRSLIDTLVYDWTTVDAYHSADIVKWTPGSPPLEIISEINSDSHSIQHCLLLVLKWQLTAHKKTGRLLDAPMREKNLENAPMLTKSNLKLCATQDQCNQIAFSR